MVSNVIPFSETRGPVATKEKILDTAETLFMEHGFEATSLRAITTAAGVNLAAVNYHFGSKEELFQTVLSRRLDPMNQERVDLLAELERNAAPDPVSCDRILTAMFIPALKLARNPQRGGTNFLRLLGRAYADPAPFIRQFLSAQYAVMIARSRSAMGPFETLEQATGRPHGIILEKHGQWIAPGHNSIATDERGNEWILYHAVDVGRPRNKPTDDINTRRVMLVDQIEWLNGWPVVIPKVGRHR